MTFTPSNTPTPTDTPTNTPTPVFLCQVVNTSGEAKFVRAQPTVQSAQISLLPDGRLANVLEIQRTENGEKWYRITYEIEGAQATGWTRSDNVREATTCPPF